MSQPEFNEEELRRMERTNRFGDLIRIYRKYVIMSAAGCVKCEHIRQMFAERILRIKTEIERWL
jgi:hypothetical protein